MSETKCKVCKKNTILDEGNICAQCKLSNNFGRNVETINNLNCGTCDLIVEENSEGLYCDVCNKWFHNACSKTPLVEYLYCLLNDAPDNVKWFCDRCIWETEKWIQSLKGRVNDVVESDADVDVKEEDLSDIEIENNLNICKRDRPRYDYAEEPEVIIDESYSTDSEDFEGRITSKRKRKHGPKKPSKMKNERSACDLCPKTFLKPEDLVAHKFWHSGDTKPFKCTICDSSFSMKDTLKKHSITHDDNKPFSCDICAKSFKWKAAYRRHLKEIHSDDKLLQCSLCDFGTTIKSRLDAHMRKHSDNRPFKCTECKYSAKTEHVLKSHMTTHSSEKPYACLECDKTFKKADRLINCLTFT